MNIIDEDKNKAMPAWRWVFPKILALKLSRNREKNFRIWTARNMNYGQNTSLVRHFGCFVLSYRAIVSFGAKFDNRDSPRDYTLHIKGRYLCPLQKGNPPNRVTLSPFKQALAVFPIKPWALGKISGMFIASRPIRCEMKPQKITDKPQNGLIPTWHETASSPFLPRGIFNFTDFKKTEIFLSLFQFCCHQRIDMNDILRKNTGSDTARQRVLRAKRKWTNHKRCLPVFCFTYSSKGHVS